jgi:hypothetical protein
MIYIKKINEDVVQLGGQVATDAMIENGWFEYNGPVPQGNHFKLVDGELVAFLPDKNDSEKYVDYKKYLDDTDHKMLSDYTLKEGENLDTIIAERATAREYCREYEQKYLTAISVMENPI